MFAVYASHTPIQHAHVRYLNNLWTDTCVLVSVGVVRAFWLVVHVQLKCEPRIEKGMAKHSLKSLRIYGVSHFSRRPCAFFTLLATAPFSRTHWAHHGLHGGSLSLSLLQFLRQSPSSYSCHNFLTMRPLASPATALRTINLRQCTELCVNRVLHS